MRYAIVSKRLSPDKIRDECLKVGGTDIKVMPLTRQIFCDLTPQQAQALSSLPGVTLAQVKKVKGTDITIPPSVAEYEQGVAFNAGEIFRPIRDAFSPPLTGEGLTVAVLDSGINDSHECLQDKVVYQANFTDAAMGDVYGHGTSVASVIAGDGIGVSPGAKLINVKVLALNEKTGLCEGSEEDVVAGIEQVCQLVQQAISSGLPITDQMFPNAINLSLGMSDDGNTDNPMRVACRTAVEEYGLDVIAAAGNDGPDLGSLDLPACEPLVVAVGGIMTDVFDIWEKSGRGPTANGETKPDYVAYATNIQTASSVTPNGYVAKNGTSFAAPIISGARGLLCEPLWRVHGPIFDVSLLVLENYAPLFCIKKEDAPLSQDNNWGWGFPVFGRMIEEIQGVSPVTAVSPAMEITQMGIMLMGLLMIGTMITKGIKAQ